MKSNSEYFIQQREFEVSRELFKRKVSKIERLLEDRKFVTIKKIKNVSTQESYQNQSQN